MTSTTKIFGRHAQSVGPFLAISPEALTLVSQNVADDRKADAELPYDHRWLHACLDGSPYRVGPALIDGPLLILQSSLCLARC